MRRMRRVRAHRTFLVHERIYFCDEEFDRLRVNLKKRRASLGRPFRGTAVELVFTVSLLLISHLFLISDIQLVKNRTFFTAKSVASSFDGHFINQKVFRIVGASSECI